MRCSIHQLHEAARTCGEGADVYILPRHAVGGKLIGQAPGAGQRQGHRAFAKAADAQMRRSALRHRTPDHARLAIGQQGRAGAERNGNRRLVRGGATTAGATTGAGAGVDAVEGLVSTIPGTLGKGGGADGNVSPANAPGEGAETPPWACAVIAACAPGAAAACGAGTSARFG